MPMEYIAIAEAAQRLGLTSARVRQLIRERVFTARRSGPKLLLVKRAEVEAEARRREGRA